MPVLESLGPTASRHRVVADLADDGQGMGGHRPRKRATASA